MGFLKKPEHSYVDTWGMSQVDCSECKRGGNGNRTCEKGGQVTMGGDNRCHFGIFLDGFIEYFNNYNKWSKKEDTK